MTHSIHRGVDCFCFYIWNNFYEGSVQIQTVIDVIGLWVRALRSNLNIGQESFCFKYQIGKLFNLRQEIVCLGPGGSYIKLELIIMF